MIRSIEMLEEQPWITAGFSTRARVKDQVRDELAAAGLLVVCPVQVHKDRVGLITEEMAEECRRQGKKELVLPDTDAVITACAGVALTTVHADCLPVWICGEDGAMGLAHAGWRGTCAAVAAKTAQALMDLTGQAPERLHAAIGPGISSCCFETGPEVYEAFAERYDFMDACARQQADGKYLLDLKEINRRQLSALGIRSIQVSSLCTMCSRDESGEPLFYSWRRDCGTKERMTAYIYRRQLL